MPPLAIKSTNPSSAAPNHRPVSPLLIRQGGADWRVPPDQALALALGLLRERKPFELVLYAGDDHGLSANFEDSRKRLFAWFKRHMH